MSFSKTWFLLEQEGLLAQACLCNGLTALRRANLGDRKGLYYSAFFELSIGIERTMKLALIIDHMARNRLSPPDSKMVENYGHKLLSLLNATKVIAIAHGVSSLNAFGIDSLVIKILGFLDRFADTGGRYSNINKLTGHKHQAMSDPITQWGEICSQIMHTQASNRERERTLLNGQTANVAFGGAAVCMISDLDQQCRDVAQLYTRVSELDVAARHATYALVTLIAALRDVLDSLCGNAWAANPTGSSGEAVIPDMKDFFRIFAWPNRGYVMRKRRWP